MIYKVEGKEKIIMTRICVCSDQSESSSAAAKWLAQSGILPNSQVLVLNVADSKNDSHSNLAAEPAETTAALLRSACPLVNVEVSSVSGPVADSLLENSFAWQSDLLVMGKNLRSGFEKLLLGSISQYVTERAHCPVMIARQSDAAAKDNVLLAVDDSECSSAAIEWLSSQSWAREKNIVLLSIFKGLPTAYNSTATVLQASEMLLRQQAKESLFSELLEQWSDSLAEDLDKKLVPFAIAEGDPAEIILKAANHWPCEMIVLGSHGRSGLTKMLLGSVSQAVAVSAPCSVLLVRGINSAKFESIRSSIVESNELTNTTKEKPHPARVLASITGTDMNGFFPNGYS